MLSDSDDTFLVEKEGKRVGSWAGGSYLGETSDFEVLHGDLDGAGFIRVAICLHDLKHG